jgi:hypothetical protein
MRIKVLIIFTLLTTVVYGQFKTNLSPMVNFHSSNATSLGQFGDVPVSLYTGTPDISLPIHKLNERGVELDINLQYNAKGVRVEDVPGWVGQNWALNAGGVITRSVRGTAFDELNFFRDKDINHLITPNYVEWSTSIGGDDYGSFNLPIFQRGYYYHTAKLNTTNWNSYNYLHDLALSSYLKTYPNQEWKQQNWRMDLEPDIFTFNFMGHSGHFFLGQDGQWKVSSKSNLKVVCNLDTDISYPVPAVPFANTLSSQTNVYMMRFPKVIDKITLIDDKGNKYLFNQVELTFNSFTSHRTPYNNDSKCISTAFYLTKVSDVNSNILYEFEYEKGPWQGRFSVSYDNNYYSTQALNPVSNSAITQYTPSKWLWHKLGFGAPGQLILPSYLKKIKSESGIEIDFNSSLVQNALKYTRGGNALFDNSVETYYGMSTNYDDLYFLYKEPDLITDTPNIRVDFNGTGIQTYLPAWDLIKNKKLNEIKIKDNSNNVVNVKLDYIDTPGIRLFLDGLNFNGTKKIKFDYSGYFLPGFLDLSTDRLGYFNNKQFKFTPSYNDVNYWTNELPALKETNDNVKIGSLSKITYPSGGYTQFEFEPHLYSKKLNENNELISSSGIIGGLRIKKIINSSNNGLEIIEYLYQKSITNSTSSGNLIYNPIYSIDSGVISHDLQYTANGSILFSRSLNSLVTMSNLMGTQVEYTDVIEKKVGNGYTHYRFSNYEEFKDINPIILHSKALPFVPKTDKNFERGSLKEKLVYNENGTLVKKDEYKYFAQNSLLVNAVNINFYAKSTFSGSFWFLPFASAYQIPYTDKYVMEESNTTYDANGKALTVFKSNRYVRYPEALGTIINNGSLFKKNEYVTESVINLGTFKTFKYPFELNNSIGTEMINKNVFPVISEKTEKTDGDPYDSNSTESLSETKLDYQSNYSSSLGDYVILPKESFIKKGDNAFEKEFLYTNYDSQGNIVEYKKENGLPISILWGYHNTKPIAILENVPYQNIPKQTINNLLNLSNQDVDNGINGITENSLRSALNSLRISFPDAMIKTYTYDSLTGVTWFSDSTEDVKYFEYDDLLRLKAVKDKNGFFLIENEYKYKTLINPED